MILKLVFFAYRNALMGLFLNGPIPASFCIFSFFSHYNFYTNWKKRRWCAWESNPGPQDGTCRQNHGATAATLMDLKNVICHLFELGHLQSLFLYFRLFNTVDITYKFCRWVDLNHGPLVPEGTALPYVPQPLPNMPLFGHVNRMDEKIKTRSR